MNKTLYKAQTQHPYTPVKTGYKSCIGQSLARNTTKTEKELAKPLLQTTNNIQVHYNPLPLKTGTA
jgi:hypothetical protein